MQTHFATLLATIAVLSLSCSEPTGPARSDGPSLAAGGPTPTVSSTIPNGAPRGTTLDVQVIGNGYDAGSKVAFLLSGVVQTKLHVNRVTFVSSKQLTANVTIESDAALAFYDVQVTASTGKKGIGTELFAVELYLELGTFGGSSTARSVNSAGVIAGRSDTTVSPTGRAFVWDPAGRRLTSLGLLEAYQVDEANNVYGSLGGASIAPARWPYDAASGIWGAPERYATLVSAPQSTFLSAVNAAGQATGRADNAAGEIHVVLWQSLSSLVDLGLCPGAYYARGKDINASGQIAGTCNRMAGSATQVDAFVWTPATPNGSTGSFVLLPAYQGRVRNFATAINDQGEVVGYSEDAKGGSVALLWRVSPGGYQAPIDLNAGAAIAGLANDINNASVVVGARLESSRGHQAAFIWDAEAGARKLPTPVNLDAAAFAISPTAPWRVAGWTRNGDYLMGTYRAVRWVAP